MSPWRFSTWWTDTRWATFFSPSFALSTFLCLDFGWKKCCSKSSTPVDPGSNQRPFDPQSNAFATELSRLQSFVAFWSIYEFFSVLAGILLFLRVRKPCLHMSPLNRLIVWRADVSGAFFLLLLNAQNFLPPSKDLLEICRNTRAGLHPASSRFSAEVYTNWAISTAWLRCLYSRYFVLLIVGLSYAFSLGLESKRPYVSMKIFNLMERHSLSNFLFAFFCTTNFPLSGHWLEKML